jgi:hypothetical protein
MTDEKREATGNSVLDGEQQDFAGEHDDTNLTDQQEGGPESSREPESPRGLSGQD